MKNIIIALLLSLALAGCADDGSNGTNGVDGVDGIDGTSGVDGVDGIDGTSGVDGVDGLNGSEAITTLTQHIYTNYRQSVYRIVVLCNGFPISAGTGFRISETEVATNKHVTSVSCTGVKSFVLQVVYDDADTINLTVGLEVFDPANESPIHDLAKIYVPVDSVGIAVTIDPNVTPMSRVVGELTVSMGFPLALTDLYTTIGHVASNIACIDSGCVTTDDILYDFIVTNDATFGSSGSPVFDLETGVVIGIVTAVIVNSGEYGTILDQVFVLDAGKLFSF